MPGERVYIAIDLKSFYASVECVDRGLDPLTTNLVVADTSRSEKTICLAVSPSLKACGIPGRARLFEVVQRVSELNMERRRHLRGADFSGASWDSTELSRNPGLAVNYIAAPPRMAHYIACSADIYRIYLNYAAPEDIHVYSIDEVFMDVTNYLKIYGLTPAGLAGKIVKDVLQATGITATAGIGTNLYLSKVAMDIMAKHVEPNGDGVRIAALDEMSYRRALWAHRPLTDFWRVGRGYARKLEAYGIFTMGDIARCSLGGAKDVWNAELLYRLFGVNAELLIDHAWGWEPCTIADIKAYKPAASSIGTGQVLPCPYSAEKAKLIVREMADSLVLDLVDRGLVTDQIVLTVGYDAANLGKSGQGGAYSGAVETDHYGRRIPRQAHGSINLGRKTSSLRSVMDAVTGLYDRIVDPQLLVRRVSITANHVTDEALVCAEEPPVQLDLFTDYAAEEKRRCEERESLERERRRQQAVLSIKKRFGKNAILRGMDLEDGATAMERNRQIGGHKA